MFIKASHFFSKSTFKDSCVNVKILKAEISRFLRCGCLNRIAPKIEWNLKMQENSELTLLND